MKKLTTKQHELLMEALRRFLKSLRGKDLETTWTGLGYRTDYKSVLDANLMEWVSIPHMRCAGWLRLSKTGAAIVQSWIDQGYTNLVWVGSNQNGWEYPMNEEGKYPPKEVTCLQSKKSTKQAKPEL